MLTDTVVIPSACTAVDARTLPSHRVALFTCDNTRLLKQIDRPLGEPMGPSLVCDHNRWENIGTKTESKLPFHCLPVFSYERAIRKDHPADRVERVILFDSLATWAKTLEVKPIATLWIMAMSSYSRSSKNGTS